MRGMNSESVDLIYLDPPFNSKANYAAPIGSEAAGAEFKDTWTLNELDIEWLDLIESKHPNLNSVIQATMVNSDKAYLIYMAVRLLEMHRILKATGSIYLHCDPTMSHYLKLMMDAIFGRGSFKNELIWKRTTAHALEHKTYSTITDRVLYYRMGNAAWNPLYLEYDKNYIEEKFRHSDQYGKFRPNELTGGKAGSEYAYMPFKGVYPPSGRAWAPPKREKFPLGAQKLLPANYEELNPLAKCEALEDAGLIYWSRTGRPNYKQYLSAMKGVPVSDLILDIPHVRGNEKIGYPTQKPLKLLDRIIRASSNPGDIVFDPFCGCATTCVAAEIMNFPRQWIGIDISPKAGELVVKRIKEHQGLFREIIHRDDIPLRTDLGKIPTYNSIENKKKLYGEQGGNCNGCKTNFLIQHFEVDHIIDRKKGGTDHIKNLQLLCSNCNRIKGDRGMEYLMAQLKI